MANVEYVRVEEMLAKRSARQSIRKQIQAEYEAYVKGLVPGQAGKVTPDKGEKPSLVRDRLRSAAKRLGTPIQLRRRSGAIYFRLKESEEAQESATMETPEQAETAPVAKRSRRGAPATAADPAPAAGSATNGSEPSKRGRGRQPSA